MKIKISIITVSFNSASTIGDTLSSVLSQNYVDFEHLIIDGLSSDKTKQIVEAHYHSKLIFSSQSDNGIYDAMNKGVQRANGDIIGILNADDFYAHESVLSEVAAAFASDPTLDAVFGDVDFVKSDDLSKSIRNYRGFGFKPWMFYFGFMPPHPAVFVRKTAYERVGLYKTCYKITADYDFLLRLLLIDSARYQATGKHWVRMRTGGVSTSNWRSNMIITAEIRRSLRENRIFSFTPFLLVRFPIKLLLQVIL